MFLDILHHIPILTTIVAVIFLIIMGRKYQRRRDPSLLWWLIGIITYGLGTALESVITVGGNTVFLNKAWYIAGAMWGGYPLGQGTVYLMYKRKTANVFTAVSLTVVIAASLLVVASPMDPTLVNPDKPGGDALGWQWIRILTPFINLYAAWFLIGGAIISALRFMKKKETLYRARGAGMIAIGGLLPGIGGSMAKAGVVEGLYVGEFFGLLFILAGTLYYSKRPKVVDDPNQAIGGKPGPPIDVDPPPGGGSGHDHRAGARPTASPSSRRERHGLPPISGTLDPRDWRQMWREGSDDGVSCGCGRSSCGC